MTITFKPNLTSKFLIIAAISLSLSACNKNENKSKVACDEDKTAVIMNSFVASTIEEQRSRVLVPLEINLYKKDGSLLSERTYSFNNDGNLKKLVNRYSKEYKMVTNLTYKENKNIIAVMEDDKGPNYDFRYDADITANLINSIRYKRNYESLGYQTIKYNAAGQVASVVESDPNAKPKKTIYFNYNCDGSLKLKKYYLGKALKFITEYILYDTKSNIFINGRMNLSLATVDAGITTTPGTISMFTPADNYLDQSFVGPNNILLIKTTFYEHENNADKIIGYRISDFSYIYNEKNHPRQLTVTTKNKNASEQIISTETIKGKIIYQNL